MNVVFISPHFPLYFHNFCSRLKNRGVNVLGIGDAQYSEISNETKESLSEYYRVNSLENYDEVYKAVAYYISKYGRIDFVESQNEYWLETDARIRSDFNICSGTKFEDLAVMKYKSKMKAVYESVGLNVARYCLIDNFENALNFGAAQPQGSLVIRFGNGSECCFTDAYDGGQNHDNQNDNGRKQTSARRHGQSLLQPENHGNDENGSQKAIDYGGDSRKEIHHRAHQGGQPLVCYMGKKHSH